MLSHWSASSVDLAGGVAEGVVGRLSCRRSPTALYASRNACQISTEFGTLGTSTVRAAWSANAS